TTSAPCTASLSDTINAACTANSTGSSGTTSSACAANSTGSPGTTDAARTAGTTGGPDATRAIASPSASSTLAFSRAAELVRGSSITVRRVPPVLRIMLPIVALASLATVHVLVVVPIEIVVVIDVDVAAVPIAIAPVAAPSIPSSGTQCNSCSPHQSCPCHK